MKKILLSAAFMLLVLPAILSSNEISAQNFSVKVGSEDKKEKKEDPKEKVVEKEVVKSGTTLEQELRKAFGMKSETSLGGSRIENLGKYFLDKYTGQVSLITYYKGEPVRWNILRDNVSEDWVNDPGTSIISLSNMILELTISFLSISIREQCGQSIQEDSAIKIPD